MGNKNDSLKKGTQPQKVQNAECRHPRAHEAPNLQRLKSAEVRGLGMGAGQCGHPAGGPGGCNELIVTPRSTFAALPSLVRRRLPLSGVSCPAPGRKCPRPARGLDHYFWLTLVPLRDASDAGGNIELLCRPPTFFFEKQRGHSRAPVFSHSVTPPTLFSHPHVERVLYLGCV